MSMHFSQLSPFVEIKKKLDGKIKVSSMHNVEKFKWNICFGLLHPTIETFAEIIHFAYVICAQFLNSA